MSASATSTARRRRWWIVPLVALTMAAWVPLATAADARHAGRAGVRAAAADDSLTTAVKQALDRFIELWKENRLEELVAGHYADDAIMVPPNHEPLRGRAAILVYLKGARDAVGEFDPLEAPFQTTTSGDLLSLVGQYSFRGGKVRFTSHELYERQPDGSVRCRVDMFGFRDPLT